MGVLSTDVDFTRFLATRDPRRVRLEYAAVPERVVLARMYDAETEKLREVLAGARRGVVKRKRPESHFAFTDRQLQIALGVLERKDTAA